MIKIKSIMIPYIVEEDYKSKLWRFPYKTYDIGFWFVYYLTIEDDTMWNILKQQLHIQQINEIDYKKKIINQLQKRKLTKSQFEELKSVLMCEKRINIYQLQRLLYSLNIMYKVKFNRGSFWSWNIREDYENSPSKFWIELLQNENGDYEYNIYEGDLNKNDCIYAQNLEKPLKSIGTYKLDELKNIAQQLCILNTYHLKKRELYNLILLKIE